MKHTVRSWETWLPPLLVAPRQQPPGGAIFLVSRERCGRLGTAEKAGDAEKMAACSYHAVPGGGESSDSDDLWDLDDHVETLNTTLVTNSNEDSLKNALTTGNVKLVESLLDSGINVDCSLRYGWTPLMYAAAAGNLAMVRLLLDKGANANFERDTFTVLMAACTANASEEHIVKCVEFLLSRNVSPNVCCRKKMTPVMHAASGGHTQVVTLLVAHGAAINAQDENGFTGLTWAAHSGHKNTVLKLLELGADIRLPTKTGNTAADIARENNHLEENDLTLRQLLYLEENELKKAGITDVKDCKKIMAAMKEIHVEDTKLGKLPSLSKLESSDELFAFLLRLNRQCNAISHAVVAVSGQIPSNPQKVVFEWDNSQNFTTVCKDILTSITELNKEVCGLQDLLTKFQHDQKNNLCRVLPLEEQQSWKWWKYSRMNLVALFGLGIMISIFHIVVKHKNTH
ncbi:ankyrin repeat, SAM and basic leucine zipper domain-containing protein 1 isoform X3 [Ranitomeya variabilis]|uniref:ankyrin repeat, SAM and basic leucine zipper domain-containing protein 1 isoform X3 n=1 Tax=Ranitomeya variabilis TaxID=490064 RepID=UPI0040577D80